jgi:AbiJ-like protein/uncharacterized protein DUF7014
MELFSKRNATVKDTYDYEIPLRVRHRIFHTIAACLQRNYQTNQQAVFEEFARRLLREYGFLSGSGHSAASPREAALQHFELCPDEQFMDFLQVCFETPYHCGGPATVNEINHVLEEENIGYELTEFRQSEPEPSGPYGGGGYHVIPPIVIKKSEKILHKDVVQPCLHRLTNTKFKTASDELLKAFSEYRKGDYSDAVTDAGAAFETVLKTICTLKRWTYDKDKATCAALVEVCRDKGLFFPFYTEIFKNVGTIRNKIGDAHGKGPQPEYPATKELAEHMLYVGCTNINLLLALANF